MIGSAAGYEYKDGELHRTDTARGVSPSARQAQHISPSRTGPPSPVATPTRHRGSSQRIALLVVYDDDEREFAYTAAAEKSVAAAEKHGWTQVSVKNDWRVVF